MSQTRSEIFVTSQNDAVSNNNNNNEKLTQILVVILLIAICIVVINTNKPLTEKTYIMNSYMYVLGSTLIVALCSIMFNSYNLNEYMDSTRVFAAFILG